MRTVKLLARALWTKIWPPTESPVAFVTFLLLVFCILKAASALMGASHSVSSGVLATPPAPTDPQVPAIALNVDGTGQSGLYWCIITVLVP